MSPPGSTWLSLVSSSAICARSLSSPSFMVSRSCLIWVCPCPHRFSPCFHPFLRRPRPSFPRRMESSIIHVDWETVCFTCFVHNLQQHGSRVHERHRLSASNEKHASSTNVTSASVAVIQFGELINTCLCFRRHVPGWLCRVVHDLIPDSMLLASCSYFAQHLFVHQVEGNTSQRTPLSTATFCPHDQIVIVWHLV